MRDEDGRDGGLPVARVTRDEALAIHRRIRVLNTVSLVIAVSALGLQWHSFQIRRSELMYDIFAATRYQLSGAALLIISLCIGAAVKGRSILFGLAGIFSIAGIVVLLLLRSRCHHCRRMNRWSTKECPACGAPAAPGWKPGGGE